MVSKSRLYWSLQAGGWLTYAVFQVVTYVASVQEVNPGRVIFFLYETGFAMGLTHLFRNVINRRHWLDLGLARLIPRVLASVVVMGLLLYVIRLPIAVPVGVYSDEEAFAIRNILGLTGVYAVFFFLWSVLYFVYNYFERYNISLKHEASLKEIELNNLKSQLNPHFMFNALNSIRALVDEDPGKSKQAINQLSNILRSSLATDRKELTRFEEELNIVKDYLGLETIRFEERLQVQFDIDPDSLEFPVPPLMVQTLIENGVKHGIARLTQGGRIELKTKVEGDWLRITIRNSGNYVNGSPGRSGGLGLHNTQQRLKLIYGDNASFRILDESNNFVRTELEVPRPRRYESIGS